jgi:hypothetical protein
MLAAILASLLLGVGEPANPLLNELLEKGLPIPQGPTLRLPPPLMKEGLSSGEQEAILKKAAGKNEFEYFKKDSLGAPYSLDLNAIDDKGKRIGQTIDLYFLAFGKLDKVKKEDVLNQLIGTESKKGKNVGKAKILSAEQLRMREIQSLNGPNLEERFACLNFLLLEKVKITGVTDNVKTSGPDWVALAMRLDPRFEKDKEFPNSWRSFDPLADEGKAFGPPIPYSGLAGYARVTQLAQPAGALFFEMHLVLHEPEAWFGGPNLLRSKLPLLIQENVRELRKKLK